MKVKKITSTALFAAIATVVMFFEFPLPFMPPFLKVDLSGAVVLIGALIFGAVPGIFMALIKDMLHLFVTTTGGVGELADFLMTLTLILIAVNIHKVKDNRNGLIMGCTIGTVGMSLMGIITNKFLLIPFYSKIMPIEAIIESCAELNPAIGSLNTYLIFGVLPFNLIKGFILSVITLLIYKRLKSFIYDQRKKIA